MWMGQGGREGGLGVRTNGLQGFCLVGRMGRRVEGIDKRFARCLFGREDGRRGWGYGQGFAMCLFGREDGRGWLVGCWLPPRGGSLERVAPSRGRLPREGVQPIRTNSYLTCRIQNPDLSLARRNGAHGGIAGRGRAGQDAYRTVCSEIKSTSYLLKYRRNVA